MSLMKTYIELVTFISPTISELSDVLFSAEIKAAFPNEIHKTTIIVVSLAGQLVL